MYNIVIVGAGGFGREIRQLVPDCFPRASVRVKGFLSSNPNDLESYEVPEPILDDPERYVPADNDRFLLAIGDIEHRRQIVLSLKSRGARFLTLIHPTATIAKTAELGEGCVLYPNSLVMNDAKLGDFVLLNLHASAGHDTRIGRYCNLCPYATMNGFSVLEEGVFLATHSSVLPGCRVGSGSKVSAGSVATHNVGPHTLVFGVPGKHISLMPK
ncbi:MAG: acetyltransferase [Pirellulales bacterium]|nr:acetyltransferase [Pirellulales bacterium]